MYYDFIIVSISLTCSPFELSSLLFLAVAVGGALELLYLSLSVVCIWMLLCLLCVFRYMLVMEIDPVGLWIFFFDTQLTIA
jgi:hypothetical protein